MEKVRNRVDVTILSSKKDFKMGIQIKLVSHKIFDNDLVSIRKNKVTLTLNKPANIGMCILELSKVLMYDLL